MTTKRIACLLGSFVVGAAAFFGGGGSANADNDGLQVEMKAGDSNTRDCASNKKNKYGRLTRYDKNTVMMYCSDVKEGFGGMSDNKTYHCPNEMSDLQLNIYSVQVECLSAQ
jgi:hypothetical protein